jgi:hypothetical protein
MPIEIPKNVNLDERIVPRFKLKINQKHISELESDNCFVYPVEFGVWDQIHLLNNNDKISSSRFKITDAEDSSIVFTIITARMFDWNIIINRREFLAQDGLNRINSRLKNGKLSHCQLYDALLLWEQS